MNIEKSTKDIVKMNIHTQNGPCTSRWIHLGKKIFAQRKSRHIQHSCTKKKNAKF